MKRAFLTLALLGLLFVPAQGQGLLKSLGNRAKQAVEKSVTKKVNNAVDKAVTKRVDKALEGVIPTDTTATPNVEAATSMLQQMGAAGAAAGAMVPGGVPPTGQTELPDAEDMSTDYDSDAGDVPASVDPIKSFNDLIQRAPAFPAESDLLTRAAKTAFFKKNIGPFVQNSSAAMAERAQASALLGLAKMGGYDMKAEAGPLTGRLGEIAAEVEELSARHPKTLAFQPKFRSLARQIILDWQASPEKQKFDKARGAKEKNKIAEDWNKEQAGRWLDKVKEFATAQQADFTRLAALDAELEALKGENGYAVVRQLLDGCFMQLYDFLLLPQQALEMPIVDLIGE